MPQTPKSISSDTEDGDSGSHSEDYRHHQKSPARKNVNDKKTDLVCTYDYLDREGLIKFLNDKNDKDTDGVLQKYITPKGDEKSVLSMIWSNKL